MGRYADAVEVYEEGLKIDPGNEQYKDAMANAIKVEQIGRNFRHI